MKTLSEFCNQILYSGDLVDKLISIPDDVQLDENHQQSIPDFPIRSKKFSFSEKKSKIPRLEHLHISENRGIAMHHFANHELMAIELFAWALLKFPKIGIEYKLDLLRTIREEQKHLKLYIARMNELGIQFGDRPMNQIFWKYTKYMQSFEKFSAILSVSFEGANLDFSLLYQKTFEKIGDETSAKIMNSVYLDEIKHVKRGLKVLDANKQNSSQWEFYNSLIEYPFTPRRAKGYFFIPETRRKVGFEEDFILKLAEYKDEFSNRKKEVIPKEMESWGIYTG